MHQRWVDERYEGKIVLGHTGSVIRLFADQYGIYLPGGDKPIMDIHSGESPAYSKESLYKDIDAALRAKGIDWRSINK